MGPTASNIRSTMNSRSLVCVLLVASLALAPAGNAAAQSGHEESEFGPVVSAYLGYLKNEQEVVDDRASRREVNRAYYRRNSNRIRALRQMAMQIATETQNDYLPELEAVAGDEFRLILERPPRFESLKVGEVLQSTFRFLGTVRSGEVFYVFARLDPYEQGELSERSQVIGNSGSSASSPVRVTPTTRARRVTNP